MGRGKSGKHIGYSHGQKVTAYKARKSKPNYPKGGFGIPHPPYAGIKRR